MLTDTKEQSADLLWLFNFTLHDLDANRAGELSDMQQYRLRLRQRRGIFIGIALVLVGALVATGFIFMGSREDNGILTVIGIGVTLCSAAITGIFGRFWMRNSADLHANRAQVFEGELERVIKPMSRSVVTYLIRVGEAEIVVSKDAFKALQHGARYRLYRTPYSGSLLSIEPVEELTA